MKEKASRKLIEINVATTFATFYFALLFYIFFLAGRRSAIYHSGKRYLLLVPLKGKIDYFKLTNHPSSLNRWNFYADFLGNIFLFIPFVFFLVYAFHVKSLKKAFLISFVTSITIECIQYIFRIGIADIDDVILNSTGALIGIAFIKLIQKIKLPFIDKSVYTLN